MGIALPNPLKGIVFCMGWDWEFPLPEATTGMIL